MGEGPHKKNDSIHMLLKKSILFLKRTEHVSLHVQLTKR
jgi:hypothetical protein